MKENELVGFLLIESKIYNPDLPTKVREELEVYKAFGLVEIDPDKEYQVDVLFNAHVYETDDEFYSFPIKKETPIPRRGRKNIPESEIRRQKIYDVLRQQLYSVLEVLEAEGMCVPIAYISGEEYLATNSVWVQIYTCEREQEPDQKKKRAVGIIRCIMPSRKGFYENLKEACKKLEESRIRAQKIKERERELRDQHTPNLVDAEKLFLEIAQAMYPSDNDKANSHKEMLYQTAVQVMEWPLQLRSKNRTEAASALDKDTRLDCPEYMMYTQYTTGGWNIEKVGNLKSAQANILHGYNLKRTDRMIVLHNVKAVSYTLFKETDEGLVMVTHEEARGEKKLYLSWNK